ncbi:MAG: hypothetical protein HQM07_08280 [Zetaproteobacteria bacterium]|nr:hypothetical protein [Zetaproteobacteria bacterium]
MRFKQMATVLALAGVGFVGSVHADETFDIHVGMAQIIPKGSAGFNQAQSLDVGNSLQYNSSKSLSVDLSFQSADSRFGINYLPMKFSSSKIFPTAVALAGTTFNAGTPVNSELNVDVWDINYTSYVLNVDDLPSRLRIGVEGAVKWVPGTFVLNNGVAANQTTAATMIPTLGLRAATGLSDFVGLSGHVSYGGERYFESDFRADYSPLPMVGVYGGYRSMHLFIDRPVLYVKATFSGFYMGAFARF